MADVQGECSYRRTDSVRRFIVGRVIDLNAPLPEGVERVGGLRPPGGEPHDEEAQVSRSECRKQLADVKFQAV
jgi:hypothetical protein